MKPHYKCMSRDATCMTHVLNDKRELQKLVNVLRKNGRHIRLRTEYAVTYEVI